MIVFVYLADRPLQNLSLSIATGVMAMDDSWKLSGISKEWLGYTGFFVWVACIDPSIYHCSKRKVS